MEKIVLVLLGGIGVGFFLGWATGILIMTNYIKKQTKKLREEGYRLRCLK